MQILCFLSRGDILAGDLVYFQALILCDALWLNRIISLTQEAGQAETPLAVENGTRGDEANAEENLDESIVMPSILSPPPNPPSCFLSCVS